MQTYGLTISGRSVAANTPDTTLVRTSVGVDEIHAYFDSAEWLDFPVRVSFGNGPELVTVPMTLSPLEDSDWAAEGTCEVPWEALQELGELRVTFQGTDASGNHIITAKGSPLTVVEEGDVPDGSVPSSAPTVDEWQQAYAQATAAISQAQAKQAELDEAVDTLVDQIDGIDISTLTVPIATVDTVGTVKPDGESITIDEDGTISAAETNGMTEDQAAALANLRRLAFYAFDSTFDDDGNLVAAVVQPTSVPMATATTRGAVLTDGDSIVLADDRISVSAAWLQSQLSTLDGALKWKGTAESVDDLPAEASVGDVYIVQGSTLFWDGSQWSEISSAIDLSPYEQSANLSEITASEVHQVTQHRGDYSSTRRFVTTDYLDAQLDAYRQGIDSDVQGDVAELSQRIDTIMEALANGRY